MTPAITQMEHAPIQHREQFLISVKSKESHQIKASMKNLIYNNFKNKCKFGLIKVVITLEDLSPMRRPWREAETRAS